MCLVRWRRELGTVFPWHMGAGAAAGALEAKRVQLGELLLDRLDKPAPQCDTLRRALVQQRNGITIESVYDVLLEGR